MSNHQRTGLTASILLAILLFSSLTARAEVAADTKPAVEQISWAKGTVRDDAGNPVVGATVFASATYLGTMRMGERTAQATTDEAGKFDVVGDAGLSYFSATLVAYKPGTVPVRAWITESDAVTPVRDFILSSRGGKLDLTVLSDQKPVARAFVQLFMDGGNLHQRSIFRGGSMSGVEAIVYPVRMTDAAGVAHFDDLPAGRYQVIASMSKSDASTVYARIPRHVRGPYAIADGIVVRSGQSSAFRMAIYLQPGKAGIRAVRHDGGPVTGSVGLSWENMGRQQSTSVTFDANGLASNEFRSPGLWRVEVRYRESPIHSIPVQEPYFTASALLAISPRLTLQQPLRMTASHFEGRSIDVELRNVDGKPARGVVEIYYPAGAFVRSETTDENGRVRLEHLPATTYILKSRIDGNHEPNANDAKETAALRKARFISGTFVPWERVTVPLNTDSHVTLQARPAGYIRGILRTPAGHRPGEFSVEFETPDIRRGVRRVMEYSDGTFIVGPFVCGKTRLRVWPISTVYPIAEIKQEVTIEAGRITEVEIKPAAPATAPSRLPAILALPDVEKPMMLGLDVMTTRAPMADDLSGHVYLPDGKTPAFGASLFFFVPGDYQPHYGAVTDAAGVIRGRDLDYLTFPDKEEPDNGDSPIAVAMIPGSYGAAIIDMKDGLNRPLSVILPNAIAVRGKLTLGGANLIGQIGVFRVLAAYQGKGKLNDVLSVWATPQADGSFELAGLTPGVYHVQAALDGIWLSQTITLNVTDRPLQPIALDIGEPGGPAVVQCVDSGGKPLRGARIVIDRPAGPLAALYWPEEFIADGAGEAWIPALEAGKHVVRFRQGAAGQEFTIKPLSSGAPVMVRLQQAPPP